MLVLARKKNESIVIGDGPNAATVFVIDIRGDKVRLGVDAAKHVPVHRREVYDAIHKERGQVNSLADSLTDDAELTPEQLRDIADSSSDPQE